MAIQIHTETMDGIREQKMILANLGGMQHEDEVIYQRRNTDGIKLTKRSTCNN